MEITPELVLERVRAAGGHLSLQDLDDEELAAWRRAAKTAQLRLLRAGHERLRRHGGPGQLKLYLVRTDRKAADTAGTWSPPEPVRPRTVEFVGRRVPVPSKVDQPHPMLERLEEAMDWPERMQRGRWNSWSPMSPRRPAQRMRRIWQAIIDEALFRGYAVAFAHNRRDHFDRGQLVTEIGWDRFPLDLYGDRTTRLRLLIADPHRRRRGDGTWTDSAEHPLEGQLGEVFTYIERRADRLVAQRDEERRRALEQRRQEEQAEAEARQHFAADHRRRVLTERLAAGRVAEDARGFGRALLAVAEGLEPDRAEQVRTWADWAFGYAQRTDPLLTLSGVPATPNPTREDLLPYLGRRGGAC